MIINHGNLKALNVAFSAAFADGLGSAPSQHGLVATRVPSTTRSNEYGWLGKFPKMREWIGDRVIHGMAKHGYTIRNKSFELTVGVDRDDIEDDNVGIYTPMMKELGQAAAEQPDELVFGLLGRGIAELCYDGQPFFDTDHPVLDEDGVTEVSQSNWGGGGASPWYLLDTSRALKPLIFQERKAPQFVPRTSETDDNVFDRKEYVYGVDSRCNVGFGFWQLAYGSQQELNEANLVAAYTAMTTRKGDHGRVLGIKPSLLVVPPNLKFAAAKLINATTLANGADNVLKGLVQVVDSSWLG